MFDPVQLRSFLAVTEAMSFTRAAERLGLRQSTVSQHVRKLEEAAGRVLLLRDTHSVALTEHGEAMLGFARAILDVQERAVGHFARSSLRGRLRFGVSEDVVLSELPAVLRAFRRRHPYVDLELTVELSATLQQRLAAGRLDLVLAKRLVGEAHGRLVRQDRLIWVGGPGAEPDTDGTVPLVVYPKPSITRERAMAALQRDGRRWRIACTSGSLTGVRAAALAGLGVFAHAEGLVPIGLAPVGPHWGLPDLGGVDFVLLGGKGADGEAARALASAIVADSGRLHRSGALES
ncbi:LysR substrate-binding domain-containing protein [Peterkaempfera sp. SMS 1(5)a]|uniref:LysR substrate-binding domain-containing protein n=1 Tax=Peterkaempfera podocarpi TaxID=3232308 RepID=UPI00366A9275